MIGDPEDTTKKPESINEPPGSNVVPPPEPPPPEPEVDPEADESHTRRKSRK
jgi:hypothetical protein